MILINQNNNKDKIYLFLINNINMFGYYNPQNYAAAVSNRIDELNKKVVYTLQHVEVLEQLLLNGGISIPNGDGSETNYNQQIQTLQNDFSTLSSLVYNVRSMIPITATEKNSGDISKLQKDYKSLAQQVDDLSDVVDNLPAIGGGSGGSSSNDYSQQIQTLETNYSTLLGKVNYIEGIIRNSASGGIAKTNYELTNDVATLLNDVGSILDLYTDLKPMIEDISAGNWSTKIQSLTNRVSNLERNTADMAVFVDPLPLLPSGLHQITWNQLINKVENFPNGITEAQYALACTQAGEVPQIQAALVNVIEQLDSQNLLDMISLSAVTTNAVGDLQRIEDAIHLLAYGW
jgi:hypothetical protein